MFPGFTKRHNVDRLVYYEFHADSGSAIYREKMIKKKPRKQKIKLIEDENPDWKELEPNWGEFRYRSSRASGDRQKRTMIAEDDGRSCRQRIALIYRRKNDQEKAATAKNEIDRRRKS